MVPCSTPTLTLSRIIKLANVQMLDAIHTELELSNVKKSVGILMLKWLTSRYPTE